MAAKGAGWYAGLMEKRVLWLLIGLVIGVAAFWYALPELKSIGVDEGPVIIPAAQEPSGEAEVLSQPASESGPAVEDSSVSVGDAVPTGEAAQPAATVAITESPEKIPSGTVALFYRASFGSDTQNLKTVVTDARGRGNLGIADISWDSGSKGIVRYIPETGQTDVIKTIRSTSYSKSSIYPVTVGDRLFSIRDWGSEWTVDNQRFTVEELDPHTGATLSSTDVTGEWFTFLNDQVFFQSAITQDFWTGGRGGGKLKVKTLGALVEQDLAVEGVRLYSVGDRLASVGEQEIRWHNPATADVQSTSYVETLSTESVWPDSRHIFFGDKSVFWGWYDSELSRINIMRAQINGEPEALVIFELEGEQTGLVVDEHEGMVVIGFASSVPPKGIGITRVFLMDTSTSDSFTELPVGQFIPSAQPDAGGGLQLLVMP